MKKILLALLFVNSSFSYYNCEVSTQEVESKRKILKWKSTEVSKKNICTGNLGRLYIPNNGDESSMECKSIFKNHYYSIDLEIERKVNDIKVATYISYTDTDHRQLLGEKLFDIDDDKVQFDFSDIDFSLLNERSIKRKVVSVGVSCNIWERSKYTTYKVLSESIDPGCLKPSDNPYNRYDDGHKLYSDIIARGHALIKKFKDYIEIEYLNSSVYYGIVGKTFFRKMRSTQYQIVKYEDDLLVFDYKLHNSCNRTIVLEKL